MLTLRYGAEKEAIILKSRGRSHVTWPKWHNIAASLSQVTGFWCGPSRRRGGIKASREAHSRVLTAERADHCHCQRAGANHSQTCSDLRAS